MPEKEWTKKQLVLWGLGMCGGREGFVDTETVGVFMFEQCPGLFSLRTRPQYPDIDVTRVQLSDAKHEKGSDGSILVIQDTDERKLEARKQGDKKRVLSRDPKWMLNEHGSAWFVANRAIIQKFVESTRALGVRRAPGAVEVSAKKISASILERIHDRRSFRRFSEKGGENLGERDLPILDFFSVFNLDAHTPEALFHKARLKVLEALSSGSVEKEYVEALSSLYASRYRTYYDEILARGD